MIGPGGRMGVVVSLTEAKAYGYCRNPELKTRKQALKAAFDHYSSVDIEAISQQLADEWVRAWQRGAQSADDES